MIKGWIIKKIGEDVYLELVFLNDEGSWDWGDFPYVMRDEDEAKELALVWEGEVKRADIFITP